VKTYSDFTTAITCSTIHGILPFANGIDIAKVCILANGPSGKMKTSPTSSRSIIVHEWSVSNWARPIGIIWKLLKFPPKFHPEKSFSRLINHAFFIAKHCFLNVKIRLHLYNLHQVRRLFIRDWLNKALHAISMIVNLWSKRISNGIAHNIGKITYTYRYISGTTRRSSKLTCSQ